MQAWLARTLVPLAAGLLLSAAAAAGLHPPGSLATAAVTIAITAAYTLLARLVERRYPALGRLLMSAGLTAAQPYYAPPRPSPSPPTQPPGSPSSSAPGSAGS